MQNTETDLYIEPFDLDLDLKKGVAHDGKHLVTKPSPRQPTVKIKGKPSTHSKTIFRWWSSD